MESHIRYLDELIQAISDSRVSSTQSTQSSSVTASNDKYPPPIPTGDDSKSLKIAKTLVNNLKDPQRTKLLQNDTIFAKTMEALDLLIRSKPYLLIIRTLGIDPGVPSKKYGLGDNESPLGIVVLLRNFLHISILNFDSMHRLWFIRRKVGSWCSTVSQLYGLSDKLRLSAYIKYLLNHLEGQLADVLTGMCTTDTYFFTLKKLYILSYWLSAPSDVFRQSLTLLDSSLPVEGWSFTFQRLSRFIIYVFDSVNLRDSTVYSSIQLRFLSLIVDNTILGAAPEPFDTLRIPSTEQFKFAVSTLCHFLENDYGASDPDNPTFAKCLLRLYSLCISLHNKRRNSEFLDIFKSHLLLDRRLNTDCLKQQSTQDIMNYLSFSEVTNRTLWLVFFDVKRRAIRDKNQLFFNDDWKVTSFKPLGDQLLPIVMTPFDERFKQLNKFRMLVLNSFELRENASTVNVIQRDMERINYGMIDLANSTNLETLFQQIDGALRSEFERADTNNLIIWTRILGHLACLESCGNLDSATNKWNSCALCDASGNDNFFKRISPDRPKAEQSSMAYKLLRQYFILSPKLGEFSEALLCGILLALHRVFTHYQPPELLRTEEDSMVPEFGIVDLCFKSRARHLRFLSARLIPLWNITNLHNDQLENTAAIIKFLQTSNLSFNVETVNMAWAQLTLTTQREIFDGLLLKLIDIFTSDVYATYMTMKFQIKTLAKDLRKTPYRLLSPILPILLKKMGKNLIEKRVSFRRTVSLLGYSARTVLEVFQRYIVPYAITQYKHDVFGGIAKLMCDNNESLLDEQKETLLKKNSRQIFAVALVKHGFFSLDIIESLFLNRLPSFDKSFVTSYLPEYKTLAEITKLYKNNTSEKPTSVENENMVLCSLHFLVTNFEKDKRHGSKYKDLSAWTAEQEEVFQRKLDDNILGIFQVFSSDLHDIEGKTTSYEKLRVINGISFLIKHASKKSILSSLAQISTCLQTALEIDDLQYYAMKCWHLLVVNLNDEELSTVVNTLVAYILQKWETLETKVKTVAYEVMDVLIKERTELVFKISPYITITLVGKLDAAILERDPNFARNAGKIRNTTDMIPIFAQNLRSNNKYVLMQTLEDIESYLRRRQAENTNSSSANLVLDDNIVSLLTTLLNVAHKYRTANRNISQMCSKCVGMIGVLDSANHKQIEISASNMVCDFRDHSQTVKFLIWVINDILVPSFWQSENPSRQLFVALVIQESLKYCGLSSGDWDINRREQYPEQSLLWDKFNTISKTTLYPLMSSLYLAQSWKEYVPLKYPSQNVREGYENWLKSLTLDLLKTATDEKHPLHVFSSLIREDDGSLSNFLLPYITMDIILKAESGTKYHTILDNLTIEFNYVFEYSLENLNHFQIDSLKMCYDSIFRVFEYCKKWTIRFQQSYNNRHGTYIVKEAKYNRMLSRVDTFLNWTPLSLLAQRSLETNSFERSALYLEQCYRQQTGSADERASILENLQKTYEEIGDVDSIDGVLKTLSTGNIMCKIEELRYSNSWKMARDYFALLGKFENQPAATAKMLKSMYDHQLYKQLLSYATPRVTSLVFLPPNDMYDFYGTLLEAANLVGDAVSLRFWMDRVESLQVVNNPSLLLHYNISKAFSFVNTDNRERALEYINKAFKLVGAHLTSSAKSTTFLKKQDLLMKLHGLYDILLLSSSTDEFQYKNHLNALDLRLKRVGADFVPSHYILSMRRSFEAFSKQPYSRSDFIKTTFNITQLSRVNSKLDIASESLMECLHYNYSPAELEFAEILWKRGENDRALKVVKEINSAYETRKDIKPRSRASVLLKYTEWLDASNNSSSDEIIQQYRDILRLDAAWDRPYYSFGLYFSKLLEKKRNEGYVTDGKLEFYSISYFLLAFEKNTRRVREYLPKVVTFWLDVAADATVGGSKSRIEVLSEAASDICKHIAAALRNCPIYIWYSVLTQLLSRLLHPHITTAKLIRNILQNLAIEYPSHILWYIAVLLNSDTPARVSCGKELIGKIKQYSPNSGDLITSAQNLTTALTKVSLQDVKSASPKSGRSLENDFKFDMKMLPSGMVVPVRINLEMVSPALSESMKNYHPFRPIVTIAKFASSYKVFASLKKPKKLTIVGSDGKLYEIMCKKEDVRQDNQYMQFATTMDFLLRKDVESKKRNLGITTYSVLSLREDCGLLEMVPNVITLRSILTVKYESAKVKYSLRALYEKWQKQDEGNKLTFYLEQTRKFRPVLYQWFLEVFPDPISWFNGRNTYARSYAVMAMVGHILGLGDRHCENILLDIQTGKVLHVDFDCLFEKGKRLPVPEIVPFRLTQNLLDAFGIVGTEGTFKKSSEVTLTLMRDNEVALMNVIETIMYDRNMDESIQQALKVVRDKIRGIDSQDGLALSVPGQAETLIQEAGSPENLSKMYIGWLPFW